MKLKLFQNKKIDFLKKNILFIIPFIILIFFNLVEHNDSISYIDNYARRPFLYPIIIDFFQIMSEDYFEFFLKIFQIFIGAYSVIYFLNFYEKKFNPDKILKSIIFLILIFPFINPSMPLANSVLSEAIAYPLFLFFLTFFLNFIIDQYKKENFIKLLFLIFLLISTRSQFYFIIPLIFLIIFFKLFKKKKFLFTASLYLIIMYFLVACFQLTYNKIKFSKFSSVNIASFQLIAIAHFVSDNKNFENISDPIHKEILSFVNNYLIQNHKYKVKIRSNLGTKKQKILLSKIKNLRNDYTKYYHFYVPIIHAYEYEVPKKIALKDDEIENLNELNKEVFKLAFNLIKQSPQDYLLLYFANVTFGLGGYFIEAENFKGLLMNVGFSGSYLFLLQIIIFMFFSVKILIKTKLKRDEKYLYTSVFLNLINICFVCIFEPPYDRYIFYTNIIFLLFLFNKIFNKAEYK